MKKLFIFTVLAMILSVSAPVNARDILGSPSQTAQEKQKLHTRLTVSQLCDLLDQWDSSCRPTVTDGAIKVRFDSINALFLLYDDGGSLQYFVRFETDVPLDRVNLWNAEYRYARHYVNTLDDGSRVITMEIDHPLSGGVSKKNIFEFFDLARVLTRNLRQNLEK